MLLPSALSCDASQPPLTRLQTALFASPPASPPQLSTQTAIGNIFTTCRSLQSLLASPAPIPAIGSEPITPPGSSHAQQLTPPMEHAPSPMKLRLRTRRPVTDNQSTSIAAGGDPGIRRKRIVKRAAPPRGPNKRRRAVDDDKGRDDEDIESELDMDSHETEDPPEISSLPQEPPRPQTPKRARIAPEIIPLGLERSDYHGLHIQNPLTEDERSSRLDNDDLVVEVDGESWSTEEDRMLVELVLEKLKLTKSDWQDCARSLGKDRNSVGRRWKSLMINGDVGIKRSSRRSKLHGTWR